MKYMLVR